MHGVNLGIFVSRKNCFDFRKGDFVTRNEGKTGLDRRFSGLITVAVDSAEGDAKGGANLAMLENSEPTSSVNSQTRPAQRWRLAHATRSSESPIHAVRRDPADGGSQS